MQRREQFDFNQRIQLRREDNSKKRKSNADAKVYIYHHWYYLSIRENSTSFILQKINTNMNANIVTLKKKVFAWLNAHGIIAIVSACFAQLLLPTPYIQRCTQGCTCWTFFQIHLHMLLPIHLFTPQVSCLFGRAHGWRHRSGRFNEHPLDDIILRLLTTKSFFS